MELHTLPNGLQLYHHNKAETDMIYKELWYKDAYLPLDGPIQLQPGHTVFDVGANIGLFSLYVRERCKGDVKLFAFEPIPSTFRILEANAGRFFAEQPGSMQVFPFGLSSSPQHATFLHHPQMSIWSTSHRDFDQQRTTKFRRDMPAFVAHYLRTEAPRWLRWLPRTWVEKGALKQADAAAQTEEVSCELRPLSGVIRDLSIDHIDLLKVDVEGHEWAVLEGIEDEHWPKIRQIVLEVEDAETMAKIQALLGAKGFAFTSTFVNAIYEMDIESELAYLWAWRGVP